MSNAVASVGTGAGSTNTNSGCGSRCRRISQAHAARSMRTPARVAHLMGVPQARARRLKFSGAGGPPAPAGASSAAKASTAARATSRSAGGKKSRRAIRRSSPAQPPRRPRPLCGPAAGRGAPMLDDRLVLGGAGGAHRRGDRVFLRGAAGGGQPDGRDPARLQDLLGQPVDLLAGPRVGRQRHQPIAEPGDPRAVPACATPRSAGWTALGAAGRRAAPSAPPRPATPNAAARWPQAGQPLVRVASTAAVSVRASTRASPPAQK